MTYPLLVIQTAVHRADDRESGARRGDRPARLDEIARLARSGDRCQMVHPAGCPGDGDAPTN